MQSTLSHADTRAAHPRKSRVRLGWPYSRVEEGTWHQTAVGSGAWPRLSSPCPESQYTPTGSRRPPDHPRRRPPPPRQVFAGLSWTDLRIAFATCRHSQLLGFGGLDCRMDNKWRIRAPHAPKGTYKHRRVNGISMSCAIRYNLELKHYPVFLDLKDRPVLVVGA